MGARAQILGKISRKQVLLDWGDVTPVNPLRLVTGLQSIIYRKLVSGRTNLQGGLVMIRDQVFQADNGDRADVPNVIIVITDGQPTTSLNTNLPGVVNIAF